MTNLTRTLTVLLGLSALIALGGCEDDAKADKDETATAEKAEKADESEKADEGAAKAQTPEVLRFAFQPQANPEAISPNADAIAEYMTKKTGIESEVFLPTNYASTVEALRADNVEVAYFSGWPYLIAHEQAGVELVAAEERYGNPFYYSQWHVMKDSDIESLSDLKGKSIAFTSPTSTSGYLFPVAKLVEETEMETGDDPKEFFGEVIYAGGYEQALKALINGKVDAAAASDYAFEQYLTDEERAKVRVLSKQGPVPTHGIAVRGELPDEVKEKIRKAVLDLNKPENQKLLESLYGAKKLVPREHDEHVSPLAEALELTGEKKGIEGFGAGSGAGSGSGHAEGSGEGSGADKGSGKGSGAGSAAGSGKGSGSGSGK
jgi:phosphonate transport system substrate-binding protein